MLENRFLYTTFKSNSDNEVLVRYFFESEFVKIPNTEINLEVDAGHWLIYDLEKDNIDLFCHETFLETFYPYGKLAKNYLEFVIDSINSDYVPFGNNLSEMLIETAEEFIEKEISLTFKSKVKLIWDLILGKKIYISKY